MLLKDTPFEVVLEAEQLDGLPDPADAPVLVLLQQPDDAARTLAQIEALKLSDHAPHIVILASRLEFFEVADSFASGVDGYLLEQISPEALLESLTLVMLGEKVFPSQLVLLMAETNWADGRRIQPPVNEASLSDREIEIMRWLSRGSPNKVIAGKMAITEATVKVHVKTILKKLGAQNRTQAAIWGIQKGYCTVVRPDDLAGSVGLRNGEGQ